MNVRGGGGAKCEKDISKDDNYYHDTQGIKSVVILESSCANI